MLGGVGDPLDRSIRSLAFQELVDERGDIGGLTGRERAMIVRSNLRDTHVVWDTESLVNLPGIVHASPAGVGAKPVRLRVFDNEQTARSDEAGPHMMIEGEVVDLVDVRFEVLGEPNVLGDNLGGGLSVKTLRLHLVGESPAGSTTRAGLLRNGEGDTLFQDTDGKCTLAIPRAPGNGEFLDIDVVSSGHLETVDDTPDTPCPCNHRRRRVAASVKGVKLALATATSVVLGSHVVIIESDGSKAGRSSYAATADTNDGTHSGAAVSRNGSGEGNRFAALGGSQTERSARVLGSETRRLGRKSSTLVLVE